MLRGMGSARHASHHMGERAVRDGPDAEEDEKLPNPVI